MSDTDLELLKRYARDRAEDTFAEIVRRHLALVYSAALRQVRSPQLAEEVAQSAFADLARNAHRLAPDTILTAWLYQVTRRTAIDVVRREARRQLREQIATEMNALNASGTGVPSVWNDIEPLLDEAMHALDETDRAAVLLRYFEHKSAREMAQTLGISDDAAQKRVSRAVERLREFFAKHGVTTSASGLVVAISANAVQAAPAGLAITISTAATLAGVTIAATATATATKAIAMTTLQKTLIAAALAASVGTGIYQARQSSLWRAQIQTLQQETMPRLASSNGAALSALQGKIDRLAAQNAALTSALAQANADKARLEREREQARHAAALFKELADQANSRDKDSTNRFPTLRHVWAGWGRLGRLSAECNKDESNLSPEEKAANAAARASAVDEIASLVKAGKLLEQDKPSGSGTLEDDTADYMACVLYGALSLDERQFGEVYALMEKHRQEIKQRSLLKENPALEAAAALKQAKERAIAEVQSLLTPEQARVFEGILPLFQVSSNRVEFGFKFTGQ
ncbi:MAG: sigma-70 family RNA polymerase sigma factor [Verrucomicrobia bacterium]|nr:sigma-70 family RNA polymerase sigma factor [Verrucomicrobiota bacterium]